MDWLGREVADPTGRRYARLDEVFVGRTSGRPEFGIVTLLGGGGDERVAVPLTRARVAGDGALVLDVDDDRVLDAPRVQRDVDEIPAEAGRLILQHFAITGDAGPGEPTEVVRHEEQLSVGTRAEATERIRVRKRVVTEDVTLTVTLRREELVIEREPVQPGTATSDASAGSDFAWAEEGAAAEFVLHAEEPVVTKRVVEVERVRLHRETTTEDRHVTESVRKERIDVDQEPLTREDPLP